MDNKLLIFFILVQVVLLALCDPEVDSNSDSFNSFGPQPNENANLDDDLSHEKDLHMFKRNEGAPDGKNIRNRPLFGEHFIDSPPAKTFENPQNPASNNFSEQKSMPQFNPQNGFQNAFNNWQQERIRHFYPNPQEIQRVQNVQTFNGPNLQTNNQWVRDGNIFQNPQQQQTVREYKVEKTVENYDGINAAKANAYANRDDNFVASSWSYNSGMDQFQQQNNPVPQKKVSVTLVNEEVKPADNFRQNLQHNHYNSQMNSNYNRNLDGFPVSNQEKGIVINFNSDCPPISKTCPDPIYHKFLYPHKHHVPRAHIPSFQIPQIPRITPNPQISQIPETPIYNRQLNTPIYCL